MNPIRLIRALPQPIKAATVLFYAAFPIVFVGAILGADLFPLLGAAFIPWGLCLATNINGGASASAREFARQASGAFDLSKTLLGSTTYFRLCGVLAIGFGIFWIVTTWNIPN